jgi:signal transduction histidine kinase
LGHPLAPLYFLPVLLVAWNDGLFLGCMISFIAAGALLITDLAAGHRYTAHILCLKASMRLVAFLILTNIIAIIREAHIRQTIFMNSIVHDLRSPAATIEMGLQRIESSLQKHDIAQDESDQQAIEAVAASAQRITTLSDDLAELTRLEAGRASLILSRVPVRSLAESAFSEVFLQAKSSEVNLVLALDAGAETVRADYSLTTRIIANLLSNAIRFSPAAGTVTLKITPGEKESLIFTVIDEGPGIPEAQDARIFEKPFQVKGGGGRSGLGLVFCRIAVEAQGGRIWVDRTAEKGATISFSLPTPISRK